MKSEGSEDTPEEEEEEDISIEELSNMQIENDMNEDLADDDLLNFDDDDNNNDQE